MGRTDAPRARRAVVVAHRRPHHPGGAFRPTTGEPDDDRRVRALVRAQLRSALATAAAVLAVLVAVPLAGALLAPFNRATVLGVPVTWPLLVGAAQLAWIALAARQARRAERLEDHHVPPCPGARRTPP